MNDAFKAERKNEFIALKQGSMTVREYVDRFKVLYKYASDIFPTEAQKCYRFKEGLQTVLKNKLSLYEGHYFRGQIEKAIEKEKLRKEIEQEGRLQFGQESKRDSVRELLHLSKDQRHEDSEAVEGLGLGQALIDHSSLSSVRAL